MMHSSGWCRGALFLLVAFVVTACQAVSFPPARDATPQSAVPQTATNTITFADTPDTEQFYAPLIAQFQTQNPAIAVQFVPIDDTVVTVSNVASIAAAADTALVSLAEPAAATAFAAVGPLRDADAAFDRQDFWPGALDACAAGGRSYGVPALVEPQFLFYDGAAFDAAQVPHPQAGWTWDQFQQAAQALTERTGSTTTRYGFAPAFGTPLALLETRVQAALLSSDPRAALADALGWYVALAQDGVVPATSGEQAATQFDALLSARAVAMWTDAPLNYEVRRNALGGEVGVVPYPVSAATGGGPSNPVTVWCTVVSGGSQHREAAWRWVSYLTTQAIRNDWRSAPARPSVADQMGYGTQTAEDLRSVVRAALERAQFARVAPATLEAVSAALTSVLDGNVELATAVRDVPFDNAASAGPGQSGPVAVVATPRSTAPPGQITIVYQPGTVGLQAQAVYQQLAEQFTREHPNLRVQVQSPGTVPLTWDTISQQFDCWEQTGRQDPALVYDLKPLLDADATLPADDFTPSSLQLLTAPNGVLVGLPMVTQSLVIRYNADLLREKGIVPPTSDWTPQDFERIARAVAGGTGDKQVYGFANQLGNGLGFLLALQGVEPYNFAASPPTARFTQLDMTNAAEQVAQLVKDGVALSPINSTQDGVTDLILQGRVALWLSYAEWQTEQTIEADGSRSKLSFADGTVAPPETSVPLPPVLTVNVALSRQVADPMPCWKWATFLSAHPEAFLGIPARRSVLDGQAYTDRQSAEVAAAFRAAASRPTQPGFSGYINLWLRQAMAAIIEGTTPAQALDAAQQKADAYDACVAAGENTDARQETCAKQVDPSIQ